MVNFFSTINLVKLFSLDFHQLLEYISDIINNNIIILNFTKFLQLFLV